MSIELVILSNHLILCFLLLPSIFPSIRVYSSESALCIMWPKYWSFRLVSCILCSVEFSHSVVSDSLLPHGLQHARPPCLSPPPGVHWNSRPSSWWCHPTISSSVVPFSSCPQSFLVSGSFQMSQLFSSGGQSIGVSASASVLPMNIQGWFPWGLTGLISLQSKGLSKSLLLHQSSKAINSFALNFLYSPTLTSLHDSWKNHSFD